MRRSAATIGNPFFISCMAHCCQSTGSKKKEEITYVFEINNVTSSGGT